jgi:hypothetical protein
MAMSTNIIFVLMYHRHTLLDLIYIQVVYRHRDFRSNAQSDCVASAISFIHTSA